jgi:hypothetical protein
MGASEWDKPPNALRGKRGRERKRRRIPYYLLNSRAYHIVIVSPIYTERVPRHAE